MGGRGASSSLISKGRTTRIIISKNPEEISNIDISSTSYKQSGRWELFNEGEKVDIADAYINAKSEMSAVNKLARKLGLHTYKDIDELKDDIKYGYYTVEKANYYDSNNNVKYQWYVSTIYPTELK